MNNQEINATAEETMFYGEFGGQYVPDTIKPALDEVTSSA